MLTPEQIRFLNRACGHNMWTYTNGVITAQRNVDIRNNNLTKILINFAKIAGFNCSYNQLSTLEGGPKEVDLYYTCSHNNLTSLIGAPVICNGDFECNNNKLTTLEGCPNIINGQFICYNNKLTTLQYAPSIIKGDFNCSYNQLSTLEGGPLYVSSDDKYSACNYSCGSNLLTNLIGAPVSCDYNFYCTKNQLTSLEGCPRVIKGDLYCQNNPNLHILYGLGRVESEIEYDNRNDLNEWIIEQAQKDIFLTYNDIAQWIKNNNKLEYLLKAQKEIRQMFSPRILHLVDSGVYNESRILDYKNFSHIC